MEEKNVTKISLSTFLLIIAIIAIIVMSVFIYKLNNDKTTEIQKSTELQSQVNSLTGTVNDLQGKINKVSETVNSNGNQENEASDVKSSTTTKTEKEIKNETIKTNTDVNKNNSKEAIYFYSSGDRNAANGNPELLYVYEFSNAKMKFNYHAIWNNEDIAGVAKSTDGEKYVYENSNRKLEILLNSMGENSVKVTEYENNSMTSEVSLFK